MTDNAGNETQAAAVEDRRVDNSPPATAIDDPGANLRAIVAIKGTASDTGSGVADVVFEISPDGASWSTIGSDNSDPYETSFDTASCPDGLYFFRTVATDVAGNVTEGAPVGPRRIDNTPPTASLNDPGANLRGAVNLSSVVDDPPGPPVASGVSVVMYEALIGGVWTGISQTWATTSVPDGVYDLRVVVADVAGNTTTSAVVAGRRVDNTPPDTSHNAPARLAVGCDHGRPQPERRRLRRREHAVLRRRRRLELGHERQRLRRRHPHDLVLLHGRRGEHRVAEDRDRDDRLDPARSGRERPGQLPARHGHPDREPEHGRPRRRGRDAGRVPAQALERQHVDVPRRRHH